MIYPEILHENEEVHTLEIEKSALLFAETFLNLWDNFILTAPMGAGKTHFLITLLKKIGKNKSIVFKPDLIYKFSPKLESRSGNVYLNVYNVSDFIDNEVFYKLEHFRLKNQKYDLVIIDEYQFLNDRELEFLKSLSTKKIFCGLEKDYLNRTFSNLFKLKDLNPYSIRIRKLCRRCKKAEITRNVRFINNILDKSGETYKTPEEDPYLFVHETAYYESMCENCYAKLC